MCSSCLRGSSRYQGPLAHLATHVLVSCCVFDRREVKLLFDCRSIAMQTLSANSRSQLVLYIHHFVTVPHDVWLKQRSSLRTRCRHYPGVLHKHRFTLLQCGASSHYCGSHTIAPYRRSRTPRASVRWRLRCSTSRKKAATRARWHSAGDRLRPAKRIAALGFGVRSCLWRGV